MIPSSLRVDCSDLRDAPPRIVPVCLTSYELDRFLARYPFETSRRIVLGWLRVRTALCCKPQNLESN